MNFPADLQLRLARLNTDLLQLQRAVQDLMHQCGMHDGNASADDLVAAAQYLALEAALRSPPPPLHSPPPREESGELLAWPTLIPPHAMSKSMPRALRA